MLVDLKQVIDHRNREESRSNQHAQLHDVRPHHVQRDIRTLQDEG